MFEDAQQKAYAQLYSEGLTKPFRELVASSIYSAVVMSRDFIRDHPELPLMNHYRAACDLQFKIPELIAKLIESPEYSFLNVIVMESTMHTVRPQVEFELNGIGVHVKKHRNAKTLPGMSGYRVDHAKNNDLQMALDFGITEMKEETKPFAIVTFNHKRFNLDYIQIGFPKEDYSGWIGRWSLMSDIEMDIVETVKKKYAPEFKEELAHKIAKEYKIDLRA